MTGTRIVLIVYAVVASLLTTIGLVLTLRFGCQLKGHHASLLIRAVSLLGCTFLSLSCLVLVFYLPMLEFSSRNVMQDVFYTLTRSFYGIGFFFIMAVAVLRLKETLSETNFELQKYIYYGLYLVYSFLWLIGVVVALGFLVASYTFVNIALLCWMSITIAFIITVVSLFINRLLKVTKSLQGNEHMHVCNGDNKNDIAGMSSGQMIIIRALTKYLFLVVIALISTCFTGAMYVFRILYKPERHDDGNEDVIVVAIHYVVIEMDCLVNILSLCLQFEFNDKSYYRFFNACHERLQSCFTKSLKLEMNQNMDMQKVSSQTNESSAPVSPQPKIGTAIAVNVNSHIQFRVDGSVSPRV